MKKNLFSLFAPVRTSSAIPVVDGMTKKLKNGPVEGSITIDNGTPCLLVDGTVIGKVLMAKADATFNALAQKDAAKWAMQNIGSLAGKSESEIGKMFLFDEELEKFLDGNTVPCEILYKPCQKVFLTSYTEAETTGLLNPIPSLTMFSAEEQKNIQARIKRIEAFGYPAKTERGIVNRLIERLMADHSEGISISPYKERFYEPGGVKYLLALTMLLIGSPVALIGDAAVGKNTMASDLANMLNVPEFDIECGQLPAEELKYTREIRDGKTEIRISDFLCAVRDGACVVLDEVNGMKGNVGMILHPLMDDRRFLHVEDCGDIRVNRRTVFILTMNVGADYAGTQKTNFALIGSRSQKITLEYLHGTIEKVFMGRGLNDADAALLGACFEAMRKCLMEAAGDENAKVADFRSFNRVCDAVKYGMAENVKDAVQRIFIDNIEDPDLRIALTDTLELVPTP